MAEELEERLTKERCFILESTTPADDAKVTIARARVEPGVTTALHSLDQVNERYLIVSGMGEVNLGEPGEWTEVRSGDVVAIPAGTPQCIRNTGDADLIFYCICSPPFTPGCYRNLE